MREISGQVSNDEYKKQECEHQKVGKEERKRKGKEKMGWGSHE